MRSTDFSLADLYAALDAQRRSRGLSWAQVTREMNGPAVRDAGHRLSPSTVSGTGHRSAAEGDGVLQMLRWLNRTPESFVPGHRLANEPGARLPDIPENRVLRFDTRKLYAAVDAERTLKKMTWAQVAAEMRLSAAMLTHLSKGGRAGFPYVMRIAGWLGSPIARFTHACDS